MRIATQVAKDVILLSIKSTKNKKLKTIIHHI